METDNYVQIDGYIQKQREKKNTYVLVLKKRQTMPHLF